MACKLQVVGSGCSRCALLETRVHRALEQYPATVEVEYVSKIVDALALGVMAIPALVLDGRVLAAGRVPSVREILDWLSEAHGQTGRAGDPEPPAEIPE